MHPSLAVVIVNTNEGRFLPRTLDALAAQNVGPARIIVVDNASTDGSVEAIREKHQRVEIIGLARNAGFAEANNVGVRAAGDCEWVALLNPDAFPEPDWLGALLQAARERPGFASFASCMLRNDDPALLDGAGDVYHLTGVAWRRSQGRAVADTPHSACPGEVFSACGGAAMYRREHFLGVGGFDEDFFCAYEDVDLGFRLRLAGHRCWYAPAAVIRHVGSVTVGKDSDFSIYHGHRNLVWAYAKNMPAPLLALSLPFHLLMSVLAVVAFVRRGRATVIMRAKIDAWRGIPRVRARRAPIQRARVASSRELLAAMATGLELGRVARSLGRAHRRPTPKGAAGRAA